jgi:DNA-binding helix-hairpin-helix protein with protein kinase domain
MEVIEEIPDQPAKYHVLRRLQAPTLALYVGISTTPRLIIIEMIAQRAFFGLGADQLSDNLTCRYRDS